MVYRGFQIFNKNFRPRRFYSWSEPLGWYSVNERSAMSKDGVCSPFCLRDTEQACCWVPLPHPLLPLRHSLLTLASSMLNCVSIRQLRVPWWFALMSQSISVCLPSIWDHLQGNHNQTPDSYLESSLCCCLSLNITFSIHKLSLFENQGRWEENMALESLEGHDTVPFEILGMIKICVMNMFFNMLAKLLQ